LQIFPANNFIGDKKVQEMSTPRTRK